VAVSGTAPALVAPATGVTSAAAPVAAASAAGLRLRAAGALAARLAAGFAVRAAGVVVAAGARRCALAPFFVSGRSPRLALRRTGRERGRLVNTSRSESCRSATCA
jgi:hypothetical protein